MSAAPPITAISGTPCMSGRSPKMPRCAGTDGLLKSLLMLLADAGVKELSIGAKPPPLPVKLETRLLPACIALVAT